MQVQEQIARAFSDRLKDALTPEQMIAVINRNKAETNPKICHSHDFCDANVLIREAAKSHNVDAFEQTDIIDQAWELAKKNTFWFRYHYFKFVYHNGIRQVHHSSAFTREEAKKDLEDIEATFEGFAVPMNDEETQQTYERFTGNVREALEELSENDDYETLNQIQLLLGKYYIPSDYYVSGDMTLYRWEGMAIV